jgi:hypothetical protein
MHRIRTTYDSLWDRRAWPGSPRATLDPNRSPQVEGDHYLGADTPTQRALIDEIIAEAQNDMLRKAKAPWSCPVRTSPSWSVTTPRRSPPSA